MRIVAISDTHCDWDKLTLPKADILIHAGDIDAGAWPDQLCDFCRWLGKQSQIKHKIVIAGNHDQYMEEHNKEARNTFDLHGIKYLENEGITINKVKIWGSPITPRFGDWWFMADRGPQIRNYWKMIPKDTDILVTHGPPFGIMDVVHHFNGPERVGCSDLLISTLTIKPKLHIFGHIHSGFGQEKIKDTLYVNASMMDEEYQIVNKPVILEI